MDAGLHHKLAEIGEGILKEALERSNPGKSMRTGAFYLGNWIADFSQLVDTQLYQKIIAFESSGKIDEIFNKFVWDAPSWVEPALDLVPGLSTVRNGLEDARKALNAAAKTLATASLNGTLESGTKSLFEVIGYGRFVVPSEKGGTPRMDPQSYLFTFKQLYKEYFPYVHLDRPKERNGVYATALSERPRNKWTKVSKSQGDLYSYLRDNIQIAAGTLAYLDTGRRGDSSKSWAAATFNSGRTVFLDDGGGEHPVNDANPQWNCHLARLGLSIHAVEDYFAHSTFVDHARGLLPEKYKRFQSSEEKEKLARRLKRWQPKLDEGKWNDLKPDTHITTGFFDHWDTVISLSHNFQHLIGFDRSGIGKHADDALDFGYRQFVQDTLELVTDPSKAFRASSNNSAAKLIRDQYQDKLGKDLSALSKGDPKLNNLVDALIESGPLADAPPEIKEAMRAGVKVFGQVKGANNIYESLKTLLEFINAPYEFIKKYVSEKLILPQVRAYVVRWVEDMVGANRIGCHSLIAKDDEASLLNTAAMECASAVHWYIIKTLTRHEGKAPIPMCLTAEGLQSTNNLPINRWIDWLELVEYFLAHPTASLSVESEKIEVPVTVVHITREGQNSAMSPDQLGNLAAEYGKNFLADPTRPDADALTWEMIADANFPTKGMGTDERIRQINKVMKQAPTGSLPVKHGNRAWAPGVRVLIPHQKTTVSGWKTSEGKRNWWYPVIIHGWSRITSSSGHRLVPVRRDVVLSQIEDSTKLRTDWEQVYKSGS